ncbi:MAG TPA: hypothetical protein VFH61_14370 [Thermoleophilia bacterium]|nr:hypothetical protein [Thermoleophilia bacterium]
MATTETAPNPRVEHVTTEEWRGWYRGVRWIIKAWNPGWETPAVSCADGLIWNYYIWVYRDQVPAERWPAYWLEPEPPDEFGSVYYPLWESFLYALNWARDCNYYRKHGGLDGLPESVEVGCDYNHTWDEGHIYSFDWLMADVRATIDDLRDWEPGLLWHCSYSGRFCAFEDGFLRRDGDFQSYAGVWNWWQWRERHKAEEREED